MRDAELRVGRSDRKDSAGQTSLEKGDDDIVNETLVHVSTWTHCKKKNYAIGRFA